MYLELVTTKNEILKVPNPLLALLTFERSEIWQKLKKKKKRLYIGSAGIRNRTAWFAGSYAYHYTTMTCLNFKVEKQQYIVISVKFHSFQKLGKQAWD